MRWMGYVHAAGLAQVEALVVHDLFDDVGVEMIQILDRKWVSGGWVSEWVSECCS